jgi:hypothetical protein
METPGSARQVAPMAALATLNCIICGAFLRGRQRAFCSRQCKNRHTNYHHQSYGKQLERGRIRKLGLVMKLGGRCVICGYARNLAGRRGRGKQVPPAVLQLPR